jgi:LuxR family maltose regulon positive regulatory protein
VLTAASGGSYNESMSEAILATKLHVPAPRAKTVYRPRLIERLNEGLHQRLTLISAPAGFGKTTSSESKTVPQTIPKSLCRLRAARLISAP